VICFGIRNEKFSSVAYVHLDILLCLWNVFSIVKRKRNWWTYPSLRLNEVRCLESVGRSETIARTNYSWFPNFAVFWMLYYFIWVIPWRLNFMCRRFGTQFHLFRWCNLLIPPMKMEQSVPKRRHIKFRRRGITQKKNYNRTTIFYRGERSVVWMITSWSLPSPKYTPILNKLFTIITSFKL